MSLSYGAKRHGWLPIGRFRAPLMSSGKDVFLELGSAMTGQWVTPIPLAAQLSPGLASPPSSPLSIDSPANRHRAEELHRAGSAAYAAGRHQEALKSFQEAAARCPNVAAYQLSVGVAWWQAGQYEVGQQFLERAII